jgi:hypothetical protein
MRRSDLIKLFLKAYIDIYIVPVRSEPSVMISCPVFYRLVSGGQVSRRLFPLPVCTVRNLPELLRQYCDRNISPGVTFEKTSAWYSGPSWKHGPDFLKRASTARVRCRSSDSSSNSIARSPAIAHGKENDFEKSTAIPGCYRGLRSATSRRLVENRSNKTDALGFSLPHFL